MIDVSKLSTNLIAVSLFSSLMVFWLGIRSLSVAHTQYIGATQLQQSVAPERVLFEVAQSLHLESTMIQNILTSSHTYGDEFELLDNASANTQMLFDKARAMIVSSRANTSENSRYRHRDESIKSLLDDLEDRLDRLSIAGAIIVAQVFVPFPKRDENVRMQLFDAYASLITDVNNLRKRTHALSGKNIIGVLTAHDIKNAIWNIRESTNRTNILLDAYLLKSERSALESFNVKNLELRTIQQHKLAQQSLENLAEMVQEGVTAGVSSKAVTELKAQYENNYRNEVRRLITVASSIDITSTDLVRWKEVSKETEDEISTLVEAALSNTLHTADSMKRGATISLFTSIILVIVCIAVAFAAFRIARNIKYQADHDDLTKLPNRRKFGELLETLFKTTDILKNEKLVLLTLDLNGFKAVNDTMGHAAGDRLLVEVAKRLVSTLDENMAVARMGGDEFAIAYSATEANEPYRVARRVKESFTPSFTVQDRLIKIDTSIGVSTYPDDAKTIEDLQITSDFAMFNSKQAGGNTIQPYDRRIASNFEKRIACEKDLKTAIENNELELYYQPQFNLDLNRANAAEALIRWNHPSRGMVSPVEFIGVAEESGLMPAIGSWVLNEACRQASQWNNTENFPIRIAVNVSVHQIMQTDFVKEVVSTLDSHNLAAKSLELEVTESVAMANLKKVVECLGTLKNLGVRIALDDFGTGYSSLNKLHELPLDTLKIDRSFIDKLDCNTDNMKSMTEAIASIAQIYNLETVAEGIESENQLIEVNKLGINVAQGYYYSKPLPRDEVLYAIASINEVANTIKKSA